MANLFVYEAKGDPAKLILKYKKAEKQFRDPKYSEGLLAHICVESFDGIRVYNLMESPEHMQKLLNDNELGAVVEEAGLSSVEVNHTFQNYKVHDYYLKT